MASRALRLVLKGKLVGAQKGYDLLKRKLDGLKKKFHDIMSEMIETKKSLGDSMSYAHSSLVEAQWGAGDFAHIMIETVKRASLKVSVTHTNIAGVHLPIFHERREEGDGEL
jgi:V-type H+-transporting ATPase subunit D